MLVHTLVRRFQGKVTHWPKKFEVEVWLEEWSRRFQPGREETDDLCRDSGPSR